MSLLYAKTFICGTIGSTKTFPPSSFCSVVNFDFDVLKKNER